MKVWNKTIDFIRDNPVKTTIISMSPSITTMVYKAVETSSIIIGLSAGGVVFIVKNAVLIGFLTFIRRDKKLDNYD